MAFLKSQLTIYVLLGLGVALTTVSAMSRGIEIDGLDPRNQLTDLSALDDRLVMQLATALGKRPRSERLILKRTSSDDLQRNAVPHKRHCWDVMDVCCILNAC